MKGIILAAYIDGIRSRKDRTVALTISTQELSPEKAGEIFSLNGKLITAYLSPSEITKDDAGLIDSIEPDMPGKTPSQRLRSILFLLWQQNNEGYKDKNMHYQNYMDRIIEFYKNKLDN